MMSYEKPDFWSLKARQEGYPARSVYKLQEIGEKFAWFRNVSQSIKILDLGAAPGSWSLYVLRTAPGALLTAVDLQPLSRQYDKGLFDKDNFFYIQGDFTSEEIREQITNRGPYALILSDAAPATTGNRTVDTLRSLALAEEALSFTGSLAPGGSLALKVFQGGDTAALLRTMRSCFESAKSFKPRACRNDSFETYYIGLGKKG